ncbi:hypothetical protein BDW59DRAFT_161206 [Aspergillus cavernicola]|uniref:Uncharacterized protein n=1 Tax=Aspergillus cavernicola TaxID=176166 RepID=A0ABR4IEA4_9EURO
MATEFLQVYPPALITTHLEIQALRHKIHVLSTGLSKQFHDLRQKLDRLDESNTRLMENNTAAMKWINKAEPTISPVSALGVGVGVGVAVGKDTQSVGTWSPAMRIALSPLPKFLVTTP